MHICLLTRKRFDDCHILELELDFVGERVPTEFLGRGGGGGACRKKMSG